MLKKLFALLNMADAAYWWLRVHQSCPGSAAADYNFQKLLKAYEVYEKECVNER